MKELHKIAPVFTAFICLIALLIALQSCGNECDVYPCKPCCCDYYLEHNHQCLDVLDCGQEVDETVNL
jgi:hypothetical protein